MDRISKNPNEKRFKPIPAWIYLFFSFLRLPHHGLGQGASREVHRSLLSSSTLSVQKAGVLRTTYHLSYYRSSHHGQWSGAYSRAHWKAPCRRGNNLSVFQLNLQTHILIQRKMPVWYHRSNTILQGAACSPRWLFTSCHDRGSNPRPLDWGAGTIPLCHSDLHGFSSLTPTTISQSVCVDEIIISK